MKKMQSGECHICGDFGPLSFEHVPPQAAFNDRPLLAHAIDEILEKGSYQKNKGKICQRGAGSYTLCQRCNNDTGAWYGKHYVNWVNQGMRILSASKGAPTLYYNFLIFPLAIIKQILCMFFSVNSVGFSENNPELVRFVLDKKLKYLPHKIKIFLYYSIHSNIRQAGVMGKMNIIDDKKSSIFSEITFPPFGYILTFDRPPHKDMLEITHFSNFGYNDFKSLFIKIPVLPVINLFPGDYRTQNEIDKDYQANIDYLKKNPLRET